MRRVLATVVLLAVVAALVVLATGARHSSAGRSYWVVLDNAFNLPQGGDVKVAGVKVGKITDFALDRRNRARVKITIDRGGFGAFRTSATCETRPQSLISDYFIDCEPGRTGRVLPDGGVIPVTHTSSSVAPDLVANIMRRPFRERLRLILGELGAGVAARGADLNAAIRRAVPALRETDNLLQILGDENATTERLVRDADTVVTALANNRRGVQDFIRFAHRTARASAERRDALQATFRRLPGFLEQLRPTMAELGRVADQFTPTLANLSASSGQLKRFFTDLGPFAGASTPALQALGRASVPGREAAVAARPVVASLRRFSEPTPELSGNLAIVLQALDDRRHAVENDPRAAVQLGRPGAKVGYTGLEALLMYVFNQSVAINPYTEFGHMLRVDLFAGGPCAPYRDAAALKRLLSQPGSNIRHCLAWLGPNQPAINRPDFTDGSEKTSAAPAAAAAGSRPAKQQAKASGGDSAALPAPLRRFLQSATGPAPSKPATTAASPATSSSSSPQGGGTAADATALLNYLLAP